MKTLEIKFSIAIFLMTTIQFKSTKKLSISRPSYKSSIKNPPIFIHRIQGYKKFFKQIMQHCGKESSFLAIKIDWSLTVSSPYFHNYCCYNTTYCQILNKSLLCLQNIQLNQPKKNCLWNYFATLCFCIPNNST